MKFLIDNQLPGALAQHLREHGFDCKHVLDVGLAKASDAEICRFAIAEERVIVSKDQDFLHHASRPEAKIKFIWVRLGNCRKAVLLEAFERLWPMIESSLQAGDRIVEIR